MGRKKPGPVYGPPEPRGYTLVDGEERAWLSIVHPDDFRPFQRINLNTSAAAWCIPTGGGPDYKADEARRLGARLLKWADVIDPPKVTKPRKLLGRKPHPQQPALFEVAN